MTSPEDIDINFRGNYAYKLLQENKKSENQKMLDHYETLNQK